MTVVGVTDLISSGGRLHIFQYAIQCEVTQCADPVVRTPIGVSKNGHSQTQPQHELGVTRNIEKCLLTILALTL